MNAPAPADADATELRALALVGSGAQTFAHDAAGKLQSLVLTIEELGMRCEDLGDVSLLAEIETARGALAELTAQLHAFRALTRPPAPRGMPIAELVARAAARAGVELIGAAGADSPGEICVSAAVAVQALARLLAAAAGEREPRRVAVGFEERAIVVPPGASAVDVELATYAFGAGGCAVRVDPRGVVVSW